MISHNVIRFVIIINDLAKYNHDYNNRDCFTVTILCTFVYRLMTQISQDNNKRTMGSYMPNCITKPVQIAKQ